MKQRLRKIFQSDNLQADFKIENDPWANDWSNIKENLSKDNAQV